MCCCREQLVTSATDSDEAFVLEQHESLVRTLSPQLARAAVLGTLVHVLQGHTGVRVEVADALVSMLNAGAIAGVSVKDAATSIAALVQERVHLKAHELETLSLVRGWRCRAAGRLCHRPRHCGLRCDTHCCVTVSLCV
jgi:hypothetical protein